MIHEKRKERASRTENPIIGIGSRSRVRICRVRSQRLDLIRKRGIEENLADVRDCRALICAVWECSVVRNIISIILHFQYTKRDFGCRLRSRGRWRERTHVPPT